MLPILITSEDVYNKLNIDLASQLNVAGQANATTVVNNYIQERQDEIAEYIALYAYGGKLTVEYYFNNEIYTDVLKNAILLQVRYALKNSETAEYGGILMQGNGIQKLSMAERLEANISPRAHTTLASAGLLYGGRV